MSDDLPEGARLSDYDFDLPDDLIATRPARPRSSARLLVATPGRIADRIVTDLPELLTGSPRDPEDTPHVLYGGHLVPEADTEEGTARLPRLLYFFQ